MKKFIPITLAAILILSMVFFTGSATPVTARGTNILEFSSMIGVPRPYTGPVNAIRGIPGGGLPWVVGSANGELKATGELEIVVVGLVIDPNDPGAIAAGRAGTNPSPTFKATVSCLSKDAGGNPLTVNVSTAPFPADALGNATIEDTVTLPSPCIAPIIFVGSPGGAWFASTGF